MNTKHVPLTLTGEEGVTYGRTPVSFGVPFSQGELNNKDNVRLVNENGQEFPVQTDVLATWGPEEDADVRWLLVDSRLSPENGSRYFLEYGEEICPAEPEQQIEVEETDDHYVIKTGVMELALRHTFDPLKQPSNLDYFTACRVKTENDWKEMFQRSPGPYSYMTDQEGKVYESFNGSQPTTEFFHKFSTGNMGEVAIEEKGPLRVCIRIRGYHHSAADGTRFCPYILRLHLFAGSSSIKCHHTFIYDQDPYKVELSSIGMKFPLNLGHDLRPAVGGSEKPHFAPTWNSFEFVQNGESGYEVYRNGKTFGSGDKTSGWATVNGTAGSALAVIRNSWQEYPKGFSFEPDGIDVQIWPETYKDNLVFTHPFEEPPVNFSLKKDDSRKRGLGTKEDEEEFKRKLEENPTGPLRLASLKPETLEDMEWIDEMVEKYAPDRVKTFSNDLSRHNNGIGAAKTTEVFLCLDTEQISDDQAESISRTVQEPLVVAVDPEYVYATGVFGHVYPAGDPEFSQTDEYIEQVHELGAECNYTGMMMYGNSNTGHIPDNMVYAYYKDKDPEKVREYCACNNEARDEMMCAWTQFIRTGSRQHFLRAASYTGNVGDVAYIHAHPYNPGSVGLMHVHGPHPWCGGPFACHTLVGGILTHYYLTGNRRLLEIAEEAADRIVAAQEPAGIISGETTLTRKIAAQLSILLEMYQVTWEKKYGDLAQRTLNWLLRTQPEPGLLPKMLGTSGRQGDRAVVAEVGFPPYWGSDYYWLLNALRLFPSKTLEDYIIGNADYYTWQMPLDAPMQFFDHAMIVCLAYSLTSDLTYAAFANYVLENRFCDYVKASAAGDFTKVTFGFGITFTSGVIPRIMDIVADAKQRDPDTFEKAQAEWKKKRDNIPPKTRTGSSTFTDIGRLSTEPHPPPERIQRTQ